MTLVVGLVGLAEDNKLPHLTLACEAQQFSCFYPDYNPTNVHRAHIATRLSRVTKIDALIIYLGLHWTLTPHKRDFVLAVAPLRVKRRQPAELDEEWVWR